MLLDPSTNAPSAEANASLQQALSAFDTPTVVGTASNVLKANAEAAAAEEELPSLEETEEETASEKPLQTTEEQDKQEETEEEVEDSSPFAAEFEQEFGMKPSEAIGLVQELQGFRQELNLMREWQVSPVEYDSRIAQVKEFFGTLPETERERFNSAEGAKAIWNHLQKQGKAQETTSDRGRGTRTTRTTRPVKPATVELLKRSDILQMDEATYQRELPRITKAFRENRVVD